MRMDLSWAEVQLRADPVHGTPCARSSHGVSVVKGGTRLVLVGGEHVARTPIPFFAQYWIGELEENGLQGEWRKVIPKGSEGKQGEHIVEGSLPSDRIAHAQAASEDRYVYVFGGRAGVAMSEKAMNDLWVLDTEKETWSCMTPLKGTAPTARSYHRMICLGPTLYVFGGCGASGRLHDLHAFDINSRAWTELPSSDLRGRGGPCLLPIAAGKKIAVVSGFAGEETADGQVYDIASGKWESVEQLTEKLDGMRPRSVCVSSTIPSVPISILFGGEVNPSEKGHEGAGGFENDLVLLDEASGHFITRRAAAVGAANNQEEEKSSSAQAWPHQRGWSDGAGCAGTEEGVGVLYVYGGLAGDDSHPVRLGDLWRLQVKA